jgi:hypothetical protein
VAWRKESSWTLDRTVSALTPPASTTAVVVVEETTGERQCFRIDLEKGEVAPC